MNFTKDFLLHLFIYDASKGVLIWKNPPKQNAYLIGLPTKTTEVNGYKCVTILKKSYKVHRIIWFLENEKWPRVIDHIDGNKTNNKISNLRSVSERVNQQNQYRHREGKLVGTSFRKTTGKWRSLIKVKGKQKELGTFNTEEEAHQRYLQELRTL